MYIGVSRYPNFSDTETPFGDLISEQIFLIIKFYLKLDKTPKWWSTGL